MRHLPGAEYINGNVQAGGFSTRNAMPINRAVNASTRWFDIHDLKNIICMVDDLKTMLLTQCTIDQLHSTQVMNH